MANHATGKGPKVIVHQLTGTPEEAAKNRTTLERVLAEIVSEHSGCPVSVKLL